MKKFTALYIFIDTAKAPGNAGAQVEALASWCRSRGIKNYRYFADHELEDEVPPSRPALERLFVKMRK